MITATGIFGGGEFRYLEDSDTACSVKGVYNSTKLVMQLLNHLHFVLEELG